MHIQGMLLGFVYIGQMNLSQQHIDLPMQLLKDLRLNFVFKKTLFKMHFKNMLSYHTRRKQNAKLTAIYTNNNHICSDDRVFGIVHLVCSVRNKNAPTQCNIGKHQAHKQNLFAKYRIVKCDELF